MIQHRRLQGIFGPPYPEFATLVHSICYHVSIPFINVCSSCYDLDSIDEQNFEELLSINLYPSNEDLNLAFHNIIRQFRWNKFLIIYDMESGKSI